MTTENGEMPVNPTPNGPESYDFGEFRLDLRQQLLLHRGEPAKLPRKTFELLTVLVRNHGRIVDKATLMNTVWQGAFVEEANVTVHISRLRKLFTSDPEPAATIETFPKTGYRFSADVREVPPTELVALDKERSSAQTDVSGTEGPAALTASSKVAPDRTRIVTTVLVLAVLLFGSGYFVNSWYRSPRSTAFAVSRVPGTEQSSSIGLSPNGEYIAHAVSAGGKRTLTIANINSGSSLQLLPPDDALFLGLTFSRDNSYLFFVKTGSDYNSLFRIPVLGGPVTRILDRIDNRISFSPDGSRFCFVRKLPDNVTVIMTAAADGSDEREIARRTAPQYYSGFEISWSPDGELIANAAGTSGNNPNIQLVGVEVETGKEIVLNDRKWAGVDGLEWLRDGSALVAGIFEGPASPTQVWLVPFPSGEMKRITNDLENYGSVGVSADGSTIMAGQFKDNTSVWVVGPGGAERSEPVRAGKHHRFQWVRWMSDSAFVFGSDAGGNRDVWRMNLDGNGDKGLTAGPQSNVMPVATADGKYIVFSAFRDNNGLFELWRMEPDGTNQVQLTPTGGGAWQPVASPDGKWIFYTSGIMDGPAMNRRIWKISIDGGQPTIFLDRAAYQPDISPDGKFVACWIKEDEKAKPQAAIFPIEGGEPVKILDGPVGNRLDWTPDGKGLSYIVTADGVSNIWSQPIDGGPARQETQFTSETIRNFDWSSGGRLLVSRYHKTRDVILIRNFR